MEHKIFEYWKDKLDEHKNRVGDWGNIAVFLLSMALYLPWIIIALLLFFIFKKG